MALDLVEVALWVGVFGGIAGIAGFFMKLRTDSQATTDRQTRQIKEMIQDKTEPLHEEFCKFNDALQEHIKEDDAVHEKVQSMEVNVSVLQQQEEYARRQLDVHEHRITKLEDR